MNRQNIIQSNSSSFPTVWYNATRFGVNTVKSTLLSRLFNMINQILVTIILSSICGISRICRIAAFNEGGLVKSILKLDKAINGNAISGTLKNLGQNSTRKLQLLLLSKNTHWLHESELESITLDTDSTVKSVCGYQKGAEKGYNTKKGAKSYLPLLVFVSDIKLLYHTWFRTGSAYMSNRIVDFLKEVKVSMPKNITKVLFRADSGFFAGGLFNLLELYKHHSTSETWIEQVKGHTMAGSTLTSDFRANDILWQLFQKSRVEWSLLQLCQDEEIISEAN